MVVLTLLLSTFGLLGYLFWRQHAANTARKPSRYPGWLPILGHAHHIIGNTENLWKLAKQWSEMSHKMGGAVCISFGPLKHFYVITDPDDCLKVANSCLDKGRVYAMSEPLLGEGLITSKTSVWRHHRKTLSPAFNQLALDEFLGVFNKQAKKLTDVLAAEAGRGPFDFIHHMERISLEAICLTALGEDFTDTTILKNKYLQATKQVVDIITKRFLNILTHSDWCFSWTTLKRQQDECIKILDNMMSTVIQGKRSEEQVKENPKKYTSRKFKTFLEILLEQNVAMGGFNDQEIRDELETIIAAGFDSVAITLTNTLVLLGTYPKVQDKLYRELEEILGKCDRAVEKSDLRQLVYLEAVIKESMRIVPLAPNVVRRIDRNVDLKNYTLYAGNECILSLYGLSRHPMWGSDAHVFRPERFLDPATVPCHPAAVPGFSIGKRNCIGRAYAMMFMKTALAHVLRHYTVTADYSKLRLTLGSLLKPTSGHNICIEKR